MANKVKDNRKSDYKKERGDKRIDSSIDETELNMYDWTFTEGKIARGYGWTIAIPDGFVQIVSKEMNTDGEKRAFELVPATFEEAETLTIPIRILPGVFRNFGLRELWMIHTEARAGVAGICGIKEAQQIAQVTGSTSEILAMGWSDISAHVVIQDTGDGTYSYQCSVETEKESQRFRVQTIVRITDKQKQCLDASVMAWLKTIRFDKSDKEYLTKTKFEENTCFDELLKGKTIKFEEAIEQAQTEYLAAINGKTKVLKYMCENGFVDGQIDVRLKDILDKGMAVKLFFLEKADQIIDKLQKKSVEDFILEKVIEKLSDLDEDRLYFIFNDEKIEITVPQKVMDIREKWKKIALKIRECRVKEEKERKAKEKLKAEAAEAKRKQEMDKWKEQVDKLKNDRKKEEQERIELIKKETTEQKERLLKVKEEKLSNCEKEIDALKQQLEDEKQELEILGFFKFSRKKELNLAIESTASKLKEKEERRADIQGEFQTDIDAADSLESEKIKALSKELEKKYVIPDSPEKIERRKKEEEYQRRIQMENEKMKEDILDALSFVYDPITIAELQETEPALSDISYQKISRVLKQLIEEGKVIKTVKKHRSYFSLV